jgi:hypothetical protein
MAWPAMRPSSTSLATQLALAADFPRVLAASLYQPRKILNKMRCATAKREASNFMEGLHT